MTDADLARALSGATRECPNHNVFARQGGDPADESSGQYCGTCGGTGRVPILNPERARKACPYVWHNADKSHFSNCPSKCHGDGWLSTLLEEPEACPFPTTVQHVWDTKPFHPLDCKGGCGGKGFVQAWRLQLLIELLEEAGCKVALTDDRWGVRVLAAGKEMHWSASLAVAACEALGVGSL